MLSASFRPSVLADFDYVRAKRILTCKRIKAASAATRLAKLNEFETATSKQGTEAS